MTEVHPCPEEAWSDGPQSLRFSDFAALMRDIEPYVRLRQRELRTQDQGDHLRALPASAATHR
jgi:3-deoxy-D-manno-octulosonic acid (KDO) 8-phosphate synthase